jgi:apolipoprotein D and lipocalin family protein
MTDSLAASIAATLRTNAVLLAFAAALAATTVTTATAQTAPTEPLAALPSLDVPTYMGTWYQVAWFPNRFQKQCVRDTTATYRRLPEGVEVLNRCRLADGRIDDVLGLARPAGSVLTGDKLEPARLEVSFLPRWLRWLPIWGDYWVIQRADDGRYAVISEASRKYLWVLSRTPQLSAADETAIRSRLVQQGFDLSPWQAHPHTAGADAPR